MNKQNNETNVTLEILINIFTVEKGKMKILLTRKKTEPYKGYWVLPNIILKNDETFEEVTEKILEETIGTKEIYTEQNYTFSKVDRNPNERVIATSYIGLIDCKTKEIKTKSDNKEQEWFTIKEIPKMAYDHKEVIEKATELLKTKLASPDILKNFFPSDFTLPELQNICESIMNTKLDRRNFRKKFINLGIIEDTGDKSKGGSGRPAKLYKFKENLKGTKLF